MNIYLKTQKPNNYEGESELSQHWACHHTVSGIMRLNPSHCGTKREKSDYPKFPKDVIKNSIFPFLKKTNERKNRKNKKTVRMLFGHSGISQEGESKVLGDQMIHPYTIWISDGIPKPRMMKGRFTRSVTPKSPGTFCTISEGKIRIVRYDEIISAYETHDDVLNKYKELVEATHGIEPESDSVEKRESE
ncbi:MAG: hypothetical protein CM15mV41_0310 [Caudoviricetes sp.]|nr:MAG: hypothetical protein CM15mV41_0310 [Caudoviricetes sp.]